MHNGKGINIAHEAVTLAMHMDPGLIISRRLGRNGARRDFSYAEFEEETSRFTNVLGEIGVQPGEAVFVLTGRIPELYIAVLGSLKRRCVVSPPFSAFGPEWLPDNFKPAKPKEEQQS